MSVLIASEMGRNVHIDSQAVVRETSYYHMRRTTSKRKLLKLYAATLLMGKNEIIAPIACVIRVKPKQICSSMITSTGRILKGETPCV
jgi:hypothetical protein